ncbi:hypothetical protein [Nitrobacter winogradskyi]|uniref:Uncharacterized protein n=2 Tax=Nitrobacter winogradskyi TaxID=913 RepID=A0ACC6AH02_NITWI|nr:hypothetical protein [Nitrobacter winogradskyi]MCP1998802.1 hypothetical protein [Nitrobacter winogradskyi]GEC14276.1 hypothetical protein NWI01_01680 [Nitrobacter winogradskyi]
MIDLPDIALSVRQPWAWAIFHGKDCENRGPLMLRHLPKPIERRIAIHAAKGMTRDEYEGAAEFMAKIGVTCPPAHELQRGGIIGSVDVTSVTKPSQPPQSRWYFGPRALMLAKAIPCGFIPAVGALGYFRWERADPSIVPPPARWMLPAGQKSRKPDFVTDGRQLDLVELVQDGLSLIDARTA